MKTAVEVPQKPSTTGCGGNSSGSGILSSGSGGGSQQIQLWQFLLELLTEPKVTIPGILYVFHMYAESVSSSIAKKLIGSYSVDVASHISQLELYFVFIFPYYYIIPKTVNRFYAEQ